MKKTSLIILLTFLVILCSLTIYTLTHKTIKGTEEIIKVKTIEQSSSNLTDQELNEVFNIELNGKRHRLKCNYHVTFADNAKIDLTLYLDGFEILSLELKNNIEASTIEEIFNPEEENKLVIKTEDLKVIKADKQDYLLITVYSNIDSFKGEYFLVNTDKELLLEHILIFDDSLNYVSTTDEELTMFYGDNQLLAKQEDNLIYALVEKETEEGIVIEEYCYTINQEITKELINTYENIKKAPKG